MSVNCDCVKTQVEDGDGPVHAGSGERGRQRHVDPAGRLRRPLPTRVPRQLVGRRLPARLVDLRRSPAGPPAAAAPARQGSIADLQRRRRAGGGQRGRGRE